MVPLTTPRKLRAHLDSGPPADDVGGVVVGGDYQGLGIARSLGRQGVPVCVIDDERSIAGASRYVQRQLRVSNLRDADETVVALVGAGAPRSAAGSGVPTLSRRPPARGKAHIRWYGMAIRSAHSPAPNRTKSEHMPEKA
jgi:hypothetical protein